MLFTNTKAFDFASSVLHSHESSTYLLSFKLRINEWEDAISIIGEPGILEVYTSMTDDSVQGLKLWVAGFGRVGIIPISVGKEHQVIVLVEKDKLASLIVDDATISSPKRSKTPKPVSSSLAASSSLRIGGGKGVEYAKKHFSGEIRQIKVCSGDFNLGSVTVLRDKSCDNGELLASAFPNLSHANQ